MITPKQYEFNPEKWYGCDPPPNIRPPNRQSCPPKRNPMPKPTVPLDSWDSRIEVPRQKNYSIFGNPASNITALLCSPPAPSPGGPYTSFLNCFLSSRPAGLPPSDLVKKGVEPPIASALDLPQRQSENTALFGNFRLDPRFLTEDEKISMGINTNEGRACFAPTQPGTSLNTREHIACKALRWEKNRVDRAIQKRRENEQNTAIAANKECKINKKRGGQRREPDIVPRCQIGKKEVGPQFEMGPIFAQLLRPKQTNKQRKKLDSNVFATKTNIKTSQVPTGIDDDSFESVPVIYCITLEL